MKTLFHSYITTFKGLSREVWMLTLVTLINRAGTMVIPFVTIYMKEELHFTYTETGAVMLCFGLGSVLGGFSGGFLANRIGHYKVMVSSLLLTGVAFVVLQYLNTLFELCVGIFITMLIADTFRPAMFVAVNAYSKPENKTRSVTLIRLAINLGFAAGPAVAGFAIETLGYGSLFWIDGITCTIAGFLLLSVLNPKKSIVLDEATNPNPKSVWSDLTTWIFLLAMMIFGFVFLQYFSTVPLFYREVHKLSELEIGLLMGLNGGFIFLLEMPLVKWLDSSKWTKPTLMMIGAGLTGFSIIVLNTGVFASVLLIGILFMTVGEMIAFPYSNSWVMERAKRGRMGSYMSMYTMAFGFSHVFGHFTGMRLIEKFGYQTTWTVMGSLMLFCMALMFWVKKRDQQGK